MVPPGELRGEEKAKVHANEKFQQREQSRQVLSFQSDDF
jgi:hypothetical protein